MRRIFSLLLLIAAWAAGPPALAVEAPLTAGDRKEIRQIIADQMEAFQRDDGVAAFAYASPTIREMFKTPDSFMAMVRRGYAPVYRPRQVEFWDLIEDAAKPTQQVYVVGPDGVPVMALYEMQRQPDGSWRIDGCRLVRSPERPA